MEVKRGNIPMVLDRKTEIFEQRTEPGRPQGRRTHQRAGLRRTHLDGHAEQGNAVAGRPAGHVCQAQSSFAASVDMDRSIGLWFNLFSAFYLE
jgi:hypothetical protein